MNEKETEEAVGEITERLVKVTEQNEEILSLLERVVVVLETVVRKDGYGYGFIAVQRDG